MAKLTTLTSYSLASDVAQTMREEQLTGELNKDKLEAQRDIDVLLQVQFKLDEANKIFMQWNTEIHHSRESLETLV